MPNSDLDFTLSNARRFYSSKGDPLGTKGLNEHGDLFLLCFSKHYLVENIRVKFQENSLVTLISEESP